MARGKTHCMTATNCQTIAISGATCSGKTSLAQLLCNELGPHCIKIHQDDFYKKVDQVPFINGYQIWDDPISIDWNTLTKHLQQIQLLPSSHCQQCRSTPSSKHTILIEGTMILHSSKLRNMCDLSFFITLDYSTCKERRGSRVYEDCDSDPPGFFDAHIWPMYCEMEKQARSLNVMLLNGIITLEDLKRTITNEINKIF